MSISSVKWEASRIKSHSADADVKKLAGLVYDLARECENIEAIAKRAENEAKHAKRAARH